MIIKKTMQPCDANLELLRYPVIAQAKFDGIKLVRFNGKLTGRSFKPLKNKELIRLCDNPLYDGFEGEIIIGDNKYSPTLCRDTTSVVNSINKTAEFTWFLFDYITEETIGLSYTQRIKKLINYIYDNSHKFTIKVKVVESVKINDEQELLSFEENILKLGGEGIIIRNPCSLYKQGRVTQKSQEVLRLKRFIHEEGEILEIIEGSANTNEAVINELGNTERSSHQENMTLNGMIGAMIVRSLRDNSIDRIGAGCMTHEERRYYFENPNEIIGKIAKYKHFPKGVKDKKRFPLFECFRMLEDM